MGIGLGLGLVVAIFVAIMLAQALTPHYPQVASSYRLALLDLLPALPIAYVLAANVLFGVRRMWTAMATFWITILILISIFVATCFALLYA